MNRISKKTKLHMNLCYELANHHAKQQNWDPPAIPVSPNHNAVVCDVSLLDDMIAACRELFRTRFNVLDGTGRPEATRD
jgi:hypothetical protein